MPRYLPEVAYNLTPPRLVAFVLSRQMQLTVSPLSIKASASRRTLGSLEYSLNTTMHTCAIVYSKFWGYYIHNRFARPGHVDNTTPVTSGRSRRRRWHVYSDGEGGSGRTHKAPIVLHFQVHMALRQFNASERKSAPASKPLHNLLCRREPYRVCPERF